MTSTREAGPLARLGANATTNESRAILMGGTALALGFVVGFLVIGGRSLPITGTGSLGMISALVTAGMTALAFVVGYLLPAPGSRRRTHSEPPDRLLRLNVPGPTLAQSALAHLL